MSNLLVDLKQFSGSDRFFRHLLFRRYLYTEGVQYLADHAGAYWLIDYIFSQQTDKKIIGHPFQVWTIKVKDDGRAAIHVEDGNDHLIKRFRIDFTDFPLKTFSLWFIDETLLLPSEY